MARSKTAADTTGDDTIKRLASCPTVAWPTIALFFACLVIIGAVWYAGIKAMLPLWAGAIINGVTAFYLFSAVHESAHNSVSRIKWLNEAVGRISVVYFAPLAPLSIGRFVHMAHHKFANDPVRDPDAFGHKLDWLFPIRWANFDYFYAKFFFTQGGSFARRKYGIFGFYAAFILGTCALIIWQGYGLELLMLWFIPTRISAFLFVLVFSFLPHQPFETLGRDNEYKATALRLGSSWILSPLMANHNYHLIHHLYPNAPFYNYQKIMAIKGDEILAHDPLMPPTFGLTSPVRASVPHHG
jgi:beta-carotene hydroxylase